mmetsp:Transcript_3468/g.8346  ORF Transcript_3468/g.8346 Transcript_3468/m.8346 type:complete len:228 (+) Transcript_3468:209-892(+)
MKLKAATKLAAPMLVVAFATIASMKGSSALLFHKQTCATRRSFSTNSNRISGSSGAIFVGGLEYSDFDELDDTSGKLTASLPTSNELSTPEEIVSMCMTSLKDGETERAGLEICYNFSSDSCRMANGGSLESFLQYANNPVFQSMVHCDRWEVVNVGSEIPGTNTRGAMKTVLVHVVPRKKPEVQHEQQRNDRKFLWTFVKERRPPRQGHFLVHECIAVDNSFAHTL